MLLVGDVHTGVEPLVRLLRSLQLNLFGLVHALLDLPLVSVVPLVPQLVQLLIVLLGVAQPVRALLGELIEVVAAPLRLLRHQFLVSLSIGLVPALLQNQLGTLLHLILKCLFSRPLHLFDSVLLPFQHLLRFDELTVPVFREKGGDGAFRVDGLLGV